jgi:hypothetical protein
MNTGVIIGILTGVTGFFLVRFWLLVDEIRKDVKEVLVRGAVRDEAMSNLKSELNGVKTDIHHMQLDIKKLERNFK